MKVKAVFFDLDDTLCDDSGAWLACSRKAAQYGVELLGGGHDFEPIAERFLAISESYWAGLDYTTDTRPLIDLRTSQFAQALAECGIDAPLSVAQDMAAHYGIIRTRDIELYPDALSTLEILRQRGVVVALITNGLATTHIEKVEYLGLTTAVDHVVVAGSVGLWKPDRRIFQHALDLCGVVASEAIMVGDNIENDVRGAQAAGIPAVWYNPRGVALADTDDAPQLGALKSLRELLDQNELFA